MNRYLWVVEIRNRSRWEPTVGVGLARADARREMNDYWRVNNPTDLFRVQKYAAKRK